MFFFAPGDVFACAVRKFSRSFSAQKRASGDDSQVRTCPCARCMSPVPRPAFSAPPHLSKRSPSVLLTGKRSAFSHSRLSASSKSTWWRTQCFIGVQRVSRATPRRVTPASTTTSASELENHRALMFFRKSAHQSTKKRSLLKLPEMPRLPVFSTPAEMLEKH